MKELNPAWVDQAISGVDPCPYFRLQSMRLASLAWGEARVEIDLDVKHRQPFGVVHGGVIATIADAAGFWAVYTQAEDGVGMTTVELKLNYLAPVKAEGKLIGLGRAIKLGRSLGLGEASVVTVDGRLAAHATTTLMVVPELKLHNQAELPPKFI